MKRALGSHDSKMIVPLYIVPVSMYEYLSFPSLGLSRTNARRTPPFITNFRTAANARAVWYCLHSSHKHKRNRSTCTCWARERTPPAPSVLTPRDTVTRRRRFSGKKTRSHQQKRRVFGKRKKNNQPRYHTVSNQPRGLCGAPYLKPIQKQRTADT